MKRKILAGMILFLFLIIPGCGKKEVLSRTKEIFIYKELYSDEYSIQEGKLNVDPKTTRIIVNATTSSGTIELNVWCVNGKENREYTYFVDGYISEEIVLDKESSAGDWNYSVRYLADTEGKIEISLYEIKR